MKFDFVRNMARTILLQYALVCISVLGLWCFLIYVMGLYSYAATLTLQVRSSSNMSHKEKEIVQQL